MINMVWKAVQYRRGALHSETAQHQTFLFSRLRYHTRSADILLSPSQNGNADEAAGVGGLYMRHPTT